MSERKRNTIIVSGLIAAAALLRLYGIGWGLPQVYEEATPLKTAWRMWNGAFDLNPHFFRYPSLTIYLQLIGQGLLFIGMKAAGAIGSVLDYRVQYVLDKTPFYVLGRSITTGFGIATVYMSYRLGRRLMGPAMGLAAAAFLAINPVHIAKSQVVEVDVVLAFFTVAALDRVVCLLDNPSRRNYLLAGVMIGLAASTKYPGAILLFPLAAAHLFARGVTPAGRKDRKPPWTYAGMALAAVVVAFAITSPYVLLDWSTFTQHLSFEREHMQLGHFGSDTTSAWWFYLRVLGTDMLGIPLALFALFGAVYQAGFKRYPWALVMVAFLVPYFAAVMSWSMHADRYLLPILPVALLFAGGALAELARMRGRLPAPARWPAIAVLVAVLAAAPVAALPELRDRLRPDTRTEAKSWIEQSIPGGSFVLEEYHGPELFGPTLLQGLQEDVRVRLLEKEAAPVYAVQYLPMLQVKPERSAAFYELALYDDVDIVVTSDAVRSRYLGEPQRFSRQVAFYDDLEQTFRKVAEFGSEGTTGPTISIYANPRPAKPFARRDSLAGPRAIAPPPETEKMISRGEGPFYNSLGLNYEYFGYPEPALVAYELAFHYPIIKPHIYRALVLGRTRCLLTMGKARDAAEFLRAAAGQTPNKEDGREFLRMRQRILDAIGGR